MCMFTLFFFPFFGFTLRFDVVYPSVVIKLIKNDGKSQEPIRASQNPIRNMGNSDIQYG